MIKKRYIVLMIFVCLFAISTVSANEMINETDSLMIDESSDLIVDNVGSNTLSISSYSSSFNKLSQEIGYTKNGGTYQLTNDFIYNSTFDSKIPKKGIEISKPITIDGNGHIIDISNFSALFIVKSDNVTLKNIKIINGNSAYGNAIVYWKGSSGICENVNFINNTAVPAVLDWGGNYGEIVNCSFINNLNINGGGGAIYLHNYFINVNDCIFVNNSALSSDYCWGGAIHTTYWKGNINNCVFINNSASCRGGAIYLGSVGGNITYCNFTNNTVHDDTEGTIHIAGHSNTIYNCIFKDDTEKFSFNDKTHEYNNIIKNDITQELNNNNKQDNKSNINITQELNNNNKQDNKSNINITQNSDKENDFINPIDEIIETYSYYMNVPKVTTTYFGDEYEPVNYNNYVNVYTSGDKSHIINIEMKKAFTGEISLTHQAYKYTSNGKIILTTVSPKDTDYFFARDGKQTMEYDLRFHDSGYITIMVAETSGSGNYKPVAQISIFNTKGIKAPDVIKYYKGDERFAVTVFDNKNNPIVNEEVNILINGNMYTTKTNSFGIASIALNLNPGKYNVTTIQGKNTLFSKVTIKSTITANNLNKIYRNGTQYYATFKDSQGNLLKNTDVKFNINGVFYTRTTNNQGTAKMNINLNPGTYILTAENPVNGEKHSNKITVLSNIVENYDLTKYYKSASQFTFRLLNDNGKPVGDGVSATININGVFYTRMSDASGYVKMNINLNPGTYIATIQYNGLMMSNTVKVLSILKGGDVFMKYRDGTKYKVQLLDSQGNPYSGEDVTFNINGVFYKRTTDDNGIARLNINLMADTYIITSEYNGLMMSNTIIVDPNPLYYTIGSNPLNYGYYMNKYNKFSLDWYYNPQWDAMVKTIYDIYGNQGMEIRDQDVRNDIKYHCYEASTGRQYILNSAGEVLPFY